MHPSVRALSTAAPRALVETPDLNTSFDLASYGIKSVAVLSAPPDAEVEIAADPAPVAVASPVAASPSVSEAHVEQAEVETAVQTAGNALVQMKYLLRCHSSSTKQCRLGPRSWYQLCPSPTLERKK